MGGRSSSFSCLSTVCCCSWMPSSCGCLRGVSSSSFTSSARFAGSPSRSAPSCSSSSFWVLERISCSSGDMKYGLSEEPSFLSKSSPFFNDGTASPTARILPEKKKKEKMPAQKRREDPDDLDHGQDERAKGQGARVVSRTMRKTTNREHNNNNKPRINNKSQTQQEQSSLSPKGPAQRGEDGVGGDVFGLLEGPVIRGEGPGQRDLAQGRHEVGAPEEEKDVVELEQDEVSVVERLPAVEGKQALGIRALSCDVSLEYSQSELLNTLYTCSLEVDRKLGRAVKEVESTEGGRCPKRRIHSSDGPVRDHHGQEDEGQQRVEQG
ncbi:hypothetical protein EYF80_055981 [Liparis tanakae]|uniref:Uncharacterized protein n=1 Tax=Liparis tanakae TaxID=230148 RepID=A0A4Z2EYL3_9TELE|nr:hypothetical protein EYF80_055981 [Liparis tanakae]